MAAKIAANISTVERITDLANHCGFISEAEGNCRRSGKRFNSMKFAISAYEACKTLSNGRRNLPTKEIGNEILELVHALDRAIEKPVYIDAAVRKLSIVSSDSQAWIKEVAEDRGRSIPPFKSWPSIEHRIQAFFEIRSLLTRGGRLVPGRKRPNGKQSRPTYVWDVIKPETPKIGRPKNDSARMFIMHMRLACLDGGYLPSLTTHHQKMTDFASLVQLLADEMRIVFDANEMINAWASSYYEANPEEEAARPRRAVKQFPRNGRETRA